MPPPPRTVKARGKKLPAGAGATAAAARRQAIERNPHILDTEEETQTAAATLEVDQETTDAKAWIKEHTDAEVARIKATGTNIELLKVKNFGVVVDMSRKKPTAINRIEIDSTLDFKLIQQIMVSPGTPYPHKENFEYVNVLLFTEGMQTPMLVPYLYDTKFKTQEPLEENEDNNNNKPSVAQTEDLATTDQRPWINVKNNLTDWLLVNSHHMRARHHIDEYHDI